MNPAVAAPKSRDAQLLGVIRAQTEIAQLGVDLAGVMTLVAERTQALTGADGAVVELAEGEEMVYRAGSGIAEHSLGVRLQRIGSLSGLCVEEAQSLTCDDTDLDPRVDRAACARVGIRSMVCTPLRHGDTVIGVLKVVARRAAGFEPGDVEILSLMSGLIAASMYHATRYSTNELFHLATHDGLTGLANRALFYDRLRNGLSFAARHRERVGVVNVDLNDLKVLNDRYGHRAGDQALVAIAAQLQGVARASDTVARMGGDEFAVIVPRLRTRDEATAVSHRLDEALHTAIDVDGEQLPLTASLGIAVYPDDGTTPEALVERADQAMYLDKRSRKQSRPAQLAPAG